MNRILKTSSIPITTPLEPEGPPAPPSPNIADTGATSHFFTIDTPVVNKRVNPSPIAIKNSNGSVMYSTHLAELPNLPNLPSFAKTVHIVPDLDGNSLVAIGPLCDAGCIVTFTATDVNVTLNDKCILTGHPSSLLLVLWQTSCFVLIFETRFQI